MKFCTKCGSSIDDNAVVCPNCGCPVEGSNAAAAAQEPAVNQAVEQVVSPVTAESQPQQQYQQQPYQQQAQPVNMGQPVAYDNKPKKKVTDKLPTLDLMALITNCVGALLGIASIICGIVFRSKFVYTYIVSSAETYGGDAYTGIQNAAAEASKNICYLIKVVTNGFSMLFVILGIVLIVYFAVKIFEGLKSRKNN